MKKRAKSVKSAKVVKKQPFDKRESSAALGLIVALTVFNLVYSYAVGLPLPRAVVASYVEAVHEIGDMQVQGYQAIGAAIVAVAGYAPESSQTASVGSTAAGEEGQTETNLIIAPNQISIAK